VLTTQHIDKRSGVAIRAVEMKQFGHSAQPSAVMPTPQPCPRPEVAAESVQAALKTVLACESFAKSPKHRFFLEFIVGEVLAGREGGLKEYTVGVEVFGRPESFDSRDDPIVRVTASRVRAKLKAYFENEGKDAPVVIELPRGSYVPTFQARPDLAKGSWEGHLLAWLPKTWRPMSWTLGTLLSMIAIVVCLFTLSRGPVVAVASAVTRGPSAGVVNSPSIAVLPFVSVGPDQSADYSARWLTAAVADVLRNVDTRRGASSQGVIGPDGQPGGDGQKDLSPDKVLQGWVWQKAGRARVTAQLIDLKSGFHIWSDVYECGPKDIFGLQHAIARAIAGELRPKQDIGSHGRFPAEHALNLEVVNFYLDGLYQMEHRTRPAVIRAIDYFQKSILISSSRFSLAYSHLAEAYVASTRYGLMPASDGLPKAQLAAEKALEIDHDSADAHASLALVNSLNWQWNSAMKEFSRAIKLDPENATLREQYALNYLLPMGRLDETLEELQKAQTLNPSSPSIEVSLGSTYYYKGNNDQAIDHCRKGLDLQSDSQGARFCLASAFEQKAMFSEATGVLNDMSSAARDTAIISISGHIFGMEGKVTDARFSLSQLDQLSKQQNISSYHRSLIYLGLGKTDDALKYIKRAYEEHDSWLMYLAVSPQWQHVRTEPRFAAILAKMGLPSV
jgi:TolB-like protein/tetratricopeptide (TPR) repeat protein